MKFLFIVVFSVPRLKKWCCDNISFFKTRFSLCILFRHNAAICYRVKTGFWDNSLYLTLFFFMLKFSISEYSKWSTYMYTFFCKVGGAGFFFIIMLPNQQNFTYVLFQLLHPQNLLHLFNEQKIRYPRILKHILKNYNLYF